jgi:hypothetical protein
MRLGWRDHLQTAGDLALLGYAVVLTAGLALPAASCAVGRYLESGFWPPGRVLWADFRRLLLPGLAAAGALAVAAGLVVLDVQALRSGRVPGGGPALVALVVAGLLIAGLAGLAVVTGPRAALRLATDRPALLVRASAVVGVALVLTVLVHPVLVPVLAGFTLFAMHVLVARLEPVARLNP